MTDTTLMATAQRHGLLDLDLLKLVNPELGTPLTQVQDLRRRFPGAFRTAVRDMSHNDYAKAKEDLLADASRRQLQQQQERAAARAMGRGGAR